MKSGVSQLNNIWGYAKNKRSGLPNASGLVDKGVGWQGGYFYRSLLCSREATILGMFSTAHPTRLLRCGRSPFPDSVRQYSTRGGTSGYTFRVTKPSASSERSVTVSIRCEISPMDLWMSLNRMVPFALKVTSVSSDHLSPSRLSISRMGQVPVCKKVFIFFREYSIANQQCLPFCNFITSVFVLVCFDYSA